MGKRIVSTAFTAGVGVVAAFGMTAVPADAAAKAPQGPATDPTWHIIPGNSTIFTGHNLDSAILSANKIPFTCSPGAASVTGHVSGDGKSYSPPTPVQLGTISAANFGQNGGCTLLGEPISAKITPGASPFHFNGRSYISNSMSRKAVGSITNISESINTLAGFTCHVIVSNTNAGSPLPGSFYDTSYVSPNGTNYGPHVFVVDPQDVAALHIKAVSGASACTMNIHVSDFAFFAGVFSARSVPGGKSLSVTAS